jgi:hypothetical protein
MCCGVITHHFSCFGVTHHRAFVVFMLVFNFIFVGNFGATKFTQYYRLIFILTWFFNQSKSKYVQFMDSFNVL